jgi:hypothetical protein
MISSRKTRKSRRKRSARERSEPGKVLPHCQIPGASTMAHAQARSRFNEWIYEKEQKIDKRSNHEVAGILLLCSVFS